MGNFYFVALLLVLSFENKREKILALFILSFCFVRFSFVVSKFSFFFFFLLPLLENLKQREVNIVAPEEQTVNSEVFFICQKRVTTFIYGVKENGKRNLQYRNRWFYLKLCASGIRITRYIIKFVTKRFYRNEPSSMLAQ